jgi:hypothetical protein
MVINLASPKCGWLLQLKILSSEKPYKMSLNITYWREKGRKFIHQLISHRVKIHTSCLWLDSKCASVCSKTLCQQGPWQETHGRVMRQSNVRVNLCEIRWSLRRAGHHSSCWKKRLLNYRTLTVCYRSEASEACISVPYSMFLFPKGAPIWSP